MKEKSSLARAMKEIATISGFQYLGEFGMGDFSGRRSGLQCNDQGRKHG
ncbi:hypothetical protein [Azospirillum endophyticum]